MGQKCVGWKCVVIPPSHLINLCHLQTQHTQDLMVTLVAKVEGMETKIEELEKTLKQVYDVVRNKPMSTVKSENTEEIEVNGVNVLQISTRDAYSFGLQLLDMMFSKEELGSSLLFKSKRSPKPGLDKERVGKLLSYVDMRYKGTYDLKTFTAKVNQKCRDANSNN